MPNLKQFLGKDPLNSHEGWEEIMGEYGCGTCKESSNVAYFSEIFGKMVWFCPNKHETIHKL
jgi:hypothetical protein